MPRRGWGSAPSRIRDCSDSAISMAAAGAAEALSFARRLGMAEVATSHDSSVALARDEPH